MRLNPELADRLDAELSQLRHQTRAERRIWSDVRASGSAKRADVRELAAELTALPSARPTSAESELIRAVCGDDVWRAVHSL